MPDAILDRSRSNHFLKIALASERPAGVQVDAVRNPCE